jgi:uncharacterized protein YkwD
VTPRNPIVRVVAATLVLATAFLLPSIVQAPAASAAGTINESMEREFASLVNQERASRGLATLPVSVSIRDVARTWSGTMAGANTLSHNSNLAGQIGNIDPSWQSLGENVGVGYSVSSLHQALMNSAGHRANILGSWTYVTVGVVTNGDKIWVTQNFIRTSTTHSLVPAPAPPPAPPTESVWLTRNTTNPGSPDQFIPYGMSGYQRLSCDWDGNGTETIGVYADNTFYLRNDNSPGTPHIAITYGWAGVTPVCGDWNGDGIDTIGIYADGQWLLRDSNTPGYPHRFVDYGWSAASPVIGDWNGDGTDGVGVYSRGDWYLRQSATPGRPEITTQYGYTGAAPVTGDWDGDGDESIGVFDGGRWSLRQDTAPGYPQVGFDYGWRGTVPIAADWNGDHTTGVAVIQP